MMVPQGAVMAPVAFLGNGMDVLAAVPAVFLKQKVETLEAMTGFETENRYKIKEYFPTTNHKGRDLFKAKEDSDCCARQFCGPSRPFTLNFELVMGANRNL